MDSCTAWTIKSKNVSKCIKNKIVYTQSNSNAERFYYMKVSYIENFK